MIIFIKSVSGKQFQVDVETFNTVESLKNLIADHEGVPPQEQRLIFGGKELSNTASLGEYSIQKESIVHLVRLLPHSAGAPSSSSSSSSSLSSSSSSPHLPRYPGSGRSQGPPFSGRPPFPPGSFPQPGYPGTQAQFIGQPPHFVGQQPPQQLPTTFCPHCLVPLAFIPGSRLIQCPRCTKLSELKPMVLLTMACGLCGCALRYAPCYSIVRCPRCQALVKTLPQAQTSPPPIIRGSPVTEIKQKPPSTVEEKKRKSYPSCTGWINGNANLYE